MSEESVSQPARFIASFTVLIESQTLRLVISHYRGCSTSHPGGSSSNFFASAAHRLTRSKVMAQVLLAFDWMAVRNRLILI